MKVYHVSIIFYNWLNAVDVGGVTARTIKVPIDHATNQVGIDATINGDTVLLTDGTCCEIINFDKIMKHRKQLLGLKNIFHMKKWSE
ncbi:MAG: hypothetical protein JSW07_11580 [bacterium]|nr:MAG: hypothetical protein JSW07_11580 [bacterium]